MNVVLYYDRMEGGHLCFSDGSVFENGCSPCRLTMNGKEVIVFLCPEANGDVYLCQHDL